MTEIQKSNGIDILTYDAVKACGTGIDHPMKDIDGITETGVVMTILGKHADAVVHWTNRIINEAFKERAIANKRGKDIQPRTPEQITEQNIEGCVVRVTGWKNVKQDFSQDLLKIVLRKNPHWIQQIVDVSDDLGNFTEQPSST